MSKSNQSGWSNAINSIEETLIALLLGLMTVITFANVIARYVFNDNILWALELTVFLFAWLVLLGSSYAVKHTIHIGVDVVIKMLPQPARKAITIFAGFACITFAALLLKGSWDYWSPFIGKRAFLETNDIPMPNFLQFFSDWLNEGERYEKLPRFIPYAVLPLSMALLTLRFIQATWQVIIGKSDMLIAAHEGEDLLEEASLADRSNKTREQD